MRRMRPQQLIKVFTLSLRCYGYSSFSCPSSTSRHHYRVIKSSLLNIWPLILDHLQY